MKQSKGYLPFIAIILLVFIVGVSYENGYFKEFLEKSNSTVESTNEGQIKTLTGNNAGSNQNEVKKTDATSDILRISQLSPDMKGKKVKIKAKIISKKDSKDGNVIKLRN